jgi:2-polyprenyl-3-methyl-5-hydroxy-6-metoxy-1,4-benzoquinol methylase
MIRDRIGAHFGSILEIGCGEGLQTKYLAPLAGRIVGIDPSQHATKRAETLNISNATFEVGDLLNFPSIAKGQIFDLVTACEVIYYLEDNQLEQAFENLNRLGRMCVVTYYQGKYARLDPFFRTKPVKFEALQTQSGEWRFIWWQSTVHQKIANSMPHLASA